MDVLEDIVNGFENKFCNLVEYVWGTVVSLLFEVVLFIENNVKGLICVLLSFMVLFGVVCEE